MPKLKTHKGTAKRIKLTSTGKLTRQRAFGGHLLAKKSIGLYSTPTAIAETRSAIYAVYGLPESMQPLDKKVQLTASL